MRKKKLWAKLMSAALSAAMVLSLMPVSALAVTGSAVAADGTYTQSVTVVNDSEDEDEWDGYTATVSLTVEDGVFTGVSLTGGGTTNAKYVGYVVDGRTRTGVTYNGLASLVGRAATYETVNSWNEYDTVSGATCTYKAAKEAALTAISGAEEATEPTVSISTTTPVYNTNGTSFEVTVTNPDDSVDYSAIGLSYSYKSTATDLTRGSDYTVSSLSTTDGTVAYTVTITGFDYNVIGQALDVTVADESFSITITSDAKVSIADNKLSVSGSNGEAVSDYLNNASSITLVYTNSDNEEVTVTEPLTSTQAVKATYAASDIFNTDGSINFECEIFADGSSGTYNLTMSSKGFSDVTATVGTTDSDDTAGNTIVVPEGLSDGTYTASGIYVDHDDDPNDGEQFTNYPIGVAVVVEDGAVVSFTVSGASGSDTQYSKRAEEGINSQIDGKGAGTYEIDTVSTATCSSVAIIKAINEALQNEAVLTAMTLSDAIYDPDGTSFTVTITNPVSDTDYSDISLAYAVGKFSDSLTSDTDYTVTLLSEDEDEIVYQVTVLDSTYNVDDNDYDHDDMNYNSIGQALDVAVGGTTVGRVTITSGATVILANNKLTLYGGNGETLADYLDSAAELTLAYTDEDGNEVSNTYTLQWAHDKEPDYTASSFFDADGNVDFTCELFAGSANGLYTISISNTGYNDVTGIVGDLVYITMNVPYDDFYTAYGLTDAAVWEVAEGIDAVSTATTSKFKGTTGLANGTYNDGTYIRGVTLAVAVSASDYEKLATDLEETDDYYFVDLEEEPTVYSTLLIDSEGNYSFSTYQTSTVSTDGLSVGEYTLTGGYGDYQISLIGVGTDMTLADGTTYGAIYGAILNTTDGGSYGMTALENLWYGTRVDYVEIAWSIVEGQRLCRAHGSGDTYYQFENMNGATLSSVTLITDLGLIEISCNLELDEYYEGDTSKLAASITNNSKIMTITGIPTDLENVTVTVDDLVSSAEVVNGEVQLDSYPEDGVQYTVTISSSNYPDITITVSTPITEGQKEELQKWINAAKELDAYESSTDLQEHAAEAEEMIANADATSYEAAELIEELMGKVKAYYPTAAAFATLEGVYLTVSFDEIELEDLENPTYILTYGSGRSTVTLTSGDLDSLRKRLTVTPEVGTEYTLTIVSDNYQDITATVTAAAATIDTTALEEAIEAAEKLNENDYTESSRAALQTALAAAKAALEAGESQDAVNEAASALNKAIEGLQAASADNGDGSSDNNESSSDSNSSNNSSSTGSNSSNSSSSTGSNSSNSSSTSSNSSNNSSSTSSSSSSDSTSVSSDATGDSTNLWIWVMLAIAATAAGGAAVKRRREYK
ncbi:MAG: FMN-binding protein [Clostridiales bacterium]|nr:FMN-binding protein [Clostridiales bacterium]